MVIRSIFVGEHGSARILHLYRVRHIVIHRLTLSNHDKLTNPQPIPDSDLTGRKIIRAFTETPLGKVTAFNAPYHLAVFQDGYCEQMLPLTTRGAHASGVNSVSFGIAVIGDFRTQKPTIPQSRALIEICSALAPLNNGLGIRSHDSFHGSSSDPTKVCPGPLLRLEALRSEALVCSHPIRWPDYAESIGLEL